MYVSGSVCVCRYMNNPRVANGIDFGAPTTTLTQIVSQHPAMVEVLNSDLKFFFIWTYTRANMPLQKMFEVCLALTTRTHTALGPWAMHDTHRTVAI